ncbi:MAG: efflux RND transporter periplasmic adaptor subunit [Akkermansiaceae bacterium]
MKSIFKVLLPFLILSIALGIGKTLIDSKKPPKSKQPPKVISQVDLIEVSPSDHQVPVISFGTVQSYFQTSVTPQVSGRIIEVSPQFRVGKMIKQNDLLARIDDTDFQAALATQQANLSLQKRTLAEEEIRAKQAAEDWLASGRKLSSASDFVLRKPQLAAAKANITSAEAAVDKALADLARTRLTAPYDAVVTSRTASLGNLATAQTSLGTLVATARAEIRIPLTAEQAARISLPTESQPNKTTIKLTSPNKPGVTWTAQLTRTEPTVDPQNQVTYVIAEVEKPYTSQKHPLAIGTFINASIPATILKNTYRIPEAALVNDAYIWIADSENKLQRIPAKRLYSFQGDSFITLTSKEAKPPLKLITRPLSNFRTGEKVKPANKKN